MYLNNTFELSLVLDAEKFSKLLNRVYNKIEVTADDEYIDTSLVSKGIMVKYRDSPYKKKVKLTINPVWVLDSDEPDSDKLIRKLEKRIDGYFGSIYGLNDFSLTGMTLTADIDIHDREKVSDYMKVLRRVGKVKGFSPPNGTPPYSDWVDDNISLCLEGNSNGIVFTLYDLERLLRSRMRDANSDRKQLESIAKKAEGLMRAEVRLMESKAIRAYTSESNASNQIADLYERSERILLDVFTRIVPFGDFHKKDKAVEIIRRDVADFRLRRRMLRLLELVPEKKSLLLAQKALNYRGVEMVMAMFAKVNLSPVTISKRHEVKKLENIYIYLT